MKLRVEEVLREVLKEFEKRGIRLVLIGSTVVDIYLGEEFKDADLDFFSISTSPLVEEELFRSIAESRGWDYSYTDLGTPRYIVRVGDREYDVDIYENISDFYIPLEILGKEVARKRIGKTKLEHITLEAYLTLKSRIGRESDEEDLKKIGKLVKSGKLKVSREKVEKILKYFPEEEVSTMHSRLVRTGIL